MQTTSFIPKHRRVVEKLPVQTYTLCKRPRYFPGFLWKLFSYFIFRWLVKYQHTVTKSHVETVTVDADDLLHKINLSQADIERVWSENCRHVIVGWNQYHELIELAEKRYGYVDNIKANAHLGNGKTFRVFGMRIHLVPWFDGVLVMPDVKFLEGTQR